MPPAADPSGRRRRRSRRGLVTLLLVAGTIAALGCSVAAVAEPSGGEQPAAGRRRARTCSPTATSARPSAPSPSTSCSRRRMWRARCTRCCPPRLADPALSRLRSLGRHLAGRDPGQPAGASGVEHGQPPGPPSAAGDPRPRRRAAREVSLDLTPLLTDLIRALEASAPVKAIPGSEHSAVHVAHRHAGQIPLLTADQVEQARGAVNADPRRSPSCWRPRRSSCSRSRSPPPVAGGRSRWPASAGA